MKTPPSANTGPEAQREPHKAHAFEAAASAQTLSTGITLLRLVPASFEPALNEAGHAGGDGPLTLSVRPEETKERLKSYWVDHLGLPMTDWLGFIFSDIAAWAQMSATSEQAVSLQLSFNQAAKDITPFMPHAGLRVIYDAVSEGEWSKAQLTEGTQPKLSEGALTVDIVATEVEHERLLGDSNARRDIFLAHLEGYNNALAHRTFNGVGGPGRDYAASVLDINGAWISRDPKRPEEEPTFGGDGEYGMGGPEPHAQAYQEMPEAGEGPEEKHAAHIAEAALLKHELQEKQHGSTANAATHTADVGHVGAEHDPAAEAERARLETDEKRARGRELFGEALERIHRAGSRPLSEGERNIAMGDIGALAAMGFGGEAQALGVELGAHMAHALQHEADEQAAERARHHDDEEARIRVNENAEAAEIKAHQLRERQQEQQDELEEEAAGIAEGPDAENAKRALDATGENVLHGRNEAAERSEILADQGTEDPDDVQRQTQDAIQRTNERTRDEMDLRARETITLVEENEIETRKLATESAAKLREKADEANRKRLEALEEHSLEASHEKLAEDRKDQGEADQRLREDIDHVKEQAAQSGEETERRTKTIEKDKEAIVSAHEQRVHADLEEKKKQDDENQKKLTEAQDKNNDHIERENQETSQAHGPENLESDTEVRPDLSDEPMHHFDRGDGPAHVHANADGGSDEDSVGDNGDMDHEIFDHFMHPHANAIRVTGMGRPAGIYAPLEQATVASTVAAPSASALNEQEAFQQAAGIQTHPPGEWAPLGQKHFALSNFHAPADASFADMHVVHAPWAVQSRRDPAARLAHALFRSEEASQGKGLRMRPPNFETTFADFIIKGPAFFPTPAPSDEG